MTSAFRRRSIKTAPMRCSPDARTTLAWRTSCCARAADGRRGPWTPHFTIGRGNERVSPLPSALAHFVIGLKLGDIAADMEARSGDASSATRQLLRWVGPEKGVLHLAAAAIVVNAVWDLWAKVGRRAAVEVARVDMSPEELVRCVDFRYITDAITPAEADANCCVAIPDARAERGARARLQATLATQRTRRRQDGSAIPTKRFGASARRASRTVGRTSRSRWGAISADDIRRAGIIREEIGPDRKLMMDANQVWDVGDRDCQHARVGSIRSTWWIQEPTSPDDVLGHATIRASNRDPTGVATGEHCQNRVVFKQLTCRRMRFDSVRSAYSCRLGGVNC